MRMPPRTLRKNRERNGAGRPKGETKAPEDAAAKYRELEVLFREQMVNDDVMGRCGKLSRSRRTCRRCLWR